MGLRHACLLTALFCMGEALVCNVTWEGGSCKATVPVCSNLVWPCGPGVTLGMGNTTTCNTAICTSLTFHNEGEVIGDDESAVDETLECKVLSRPVDKNGKISGKFGRFDVSGGACPLIRYTADEKHFASSFTGFSLAETFPCYLRENCTAVASTQEERLQPGSSNVLDAVLFFSIATVVLIILYGVSRLGNFSDTEPLKDDPENIVHSHICNPASVSSTSSVHAETHNSLYHAPRQGLSPTLDMTMHEASSSAFNEMGSLSVRNAGGHMMHPLSVNVHGEEGRGVGGQHVPGGVAEQSPREGRSKERDAAAAALLRAGFRRGLGGSVKSVSSGGPPAPSRSASKVVYGVL